MWLFLAVAVVLIGVVLAMVLPALLRPQSATKADANEEKRAIFRQQFDEIEQDKLNGVLDGEQYQIAKTELERRMLDEIGSSGVVSLHTQPDRRLALILSILIPLLAFWLYVKIGKPEVLLNPVSDAPVIADVATLEHKAMSGDIEPLLVALKDKLEKNPGNGEGWALLARSYVELKRHADAVNAYEMATKIITDDPQLYADYADALAVVNGGKLAGAPDELVNKALKLDPHHQKALMLSATAAFDRQDYKQAISLWERLQQLLPADSEMRPYVQASLNETYAVSGEKPSANKTTELSTENTATQAVEKLTTGISGTVHIAPALVSQLDSSATLFVFARATQGSPMPVAIARATAKDLPYRFHLDDSSALISNNKLSQASEVVLVARISKSGDAKSQAGDLQGQTKAMKTVGEGVDIEINELVK